MPGELQRCSSVSWTGLSLGLPLPPKGEALSQGERQEPGAVCVSFGLKVITPVSYFVLFPATGLSLALLPLPVKKEGWT